MPHRNSKSIAAKGILLTAIAVSWHPLVRIGIPSCTNTELSFLNCGYFWWWLLAIFLLGIVVAIAINERT